MEITTSLEELEDLDTTTRFPDEKAKKNILKSAQRKHFEVEENKTA